MYFFEMYLRLSAHFHFIFWPWRRDNRLLISRVSRVEAFKRQQLIEISLIRFAVLLEVAPLACDIRSGVEDHDPLIDGMSRRVLHDHAHDASDELHEGRQVAENAEYGSYCQQWMIEALPQLAYL